MDNLKSLLRILTGLLLGGLFILASIPFMVIVFILIMIDNGTAINLDIDDSKE